MTTEPLAVGRRVFVSGRSNITSGGAAGGVDWRNVLIVDKDGGGDHTTIQAAIDAATSPSASNPWLVLVMPGEYDENITLVAHVHVAALVPETVFVDLDLSGGTGMTSVDNVTLDGLKFRVNSTTNIAISTTSTHHDFVMRGCILENSAASTNGNLQAAGGRFEECLFDDMTVTFAGSNAEDQPKFKGCHFRSESTGGGGNAQMNAASTTSYGVWSGGSITGRVTDNTNFFAVNSRNVELAGVNVFSDNGMGMSVRCRFSGAIFDIVMNDPIGGDVGLGIEIDGAEFAGCVFRFSGEGGTNIGCFVVVTQSVRDSLFTGCTIVNDSQSTPFILFDDGITGDTFGLKITGTIFETGSQSGTIPTLFATHSSGFAGQMMVTLNGNSYHATQSSMPTASPGAGTLRFRGKDVLSRIWPVTLGVGTGASQTVDRHPVVELNLATETAFIAGRVAPPAGVKIGAQLIVSAENSDGIHTDTFTDPNGTLLTAHTSDSGGTWTGANIDIQSNTAHPTSTSELFGIYSIAAANGHLQAASVTAGASGLSEKRAGIVFRFADSSNHWRFYFRDDNAGVTLVKVVAGVETVVWDLNGGSSGSLAVSFIGNTIRWTVSGTIYGEIEDSALASNTGVGIYFKGSTSVGLSVDGFQFTPGGEADLTIEANYGKWGEPFPNNAPTAVTAAGADVVHHAYSYVDISSLIAANPEEDFYGFEVTLDALAGNITDVYVHGVQVQVLPLLFGENAFTSKDPENGIIYR